MYTIHSGSDGVLQGNMSGLLVEYKFAWYYCKCKKCLRDETFAKRFKILKPIKLLTFVLPSQYNYRGRGSIQPGQNALRLKITSRERIKKRTRQLQGQLSQTFVSGRKAYIASVEFWLHK